MTTQAMAESTEKLHGVHYSTRILSAELSYNDQILVKDTPTGKEMTFVRSKPTEKMKTSRKDNQTPIQVKLTANQHNLSDAEYSSFRFLSNPMAAYSVALP
jgi:hypothetical protein